MKPEAKRDIERRIEENERASRGRDRLDLDLCVEVGEKGESPCRRSSGVRPKSLSRRRVREDRGTEGWARLCKGLRCPEGETFFLRKLARRRGCLRRLREMNHWSSSSSACPACGSSKANAVQDGRGRRGLREGGLTLAFAEPPRAFPVFGKGAKLLTRVPPIQLPNLALAVIASSQQTCRREGLSESQA